MAEGGICSHGTLCGFTSCLLSWKAAVLFAMISTMSWSAVTCTPARANNASSIRLEHPCEVRNGEKLSSDCLRYLGSRCVFPDLARHQECRSWYINVFGSIVAMSMRSCQERSRLAELDHSMVRVLISATANEFPELLSILAYLQNRSPESMCATFHPHQVDDLLRGVDENQSTVLVDALPSTQPSGERAMASIRRFVSRGGTLVTLKSSFHLANALYDQHSLNRTTIPHAWRRRRDGVMVVLKKSKHRYSNDHRRSAIGTCAGDEDMLRVWRWYTERKTPSYWPVGNDTLLVQKSTGLSARPTRLHSLLRVAKHSEHLSVLVCYDLQRGSVFHVSGDLRHAEHRWRSRKRLRDGLFSVLKAQFKSQFRRFWKNYTRRAANYEAAQPLSEMAHLVRTLRITDREIQSAAMASDIVLGMLLKNWKQGHVSQGPCSE